MTHNLKLIPSKPSVLRADSHPTIGDIIQRDRGIIVDLWAARAKSEQPSATRVHHDVLLDHLPVFLWELGRSISENGDIGRPTRPAKIHGDQRWENGWSIAEVVRDYQILRIVLVEYLEKLLHRSLSSAECLTLNVIVDDAIAVSVAAYSVSDKEAAIPKEHSPSSSTGGLFDNLAFLGHELRNLLAPLGNGLQLLKLASASPTQIEKTRVLMERQFKAMTRLVEDLLDVPRLARGKFSLKQERLDLVKLVRECIEDRMETYKSAGITLLATIPDLRLETVGDATRISQAIGNILINALKFTDKGGTVIVELQVSATPKIARISISDNGVGIEQSFLPNIFNSFMQGEQTMERSRAGLGLGLALVKGIVELHGGSVVAKSDGPGCGSQFILELPILDIPPHTSPLESSKELVTTENKYRVLIIEDNEDSAESLKSYLEILGHRVQLASTGQDGIAVAKNFHPDVVVCDIGLPGMNGYEVCNAIKNANLGTSPLMIALSGHSSAGNKETCFGAGFDEFLLKPATPEEVMACIVSQKR
jgi:signal transduction histidine kinase/CheY-like chemotaxis protein